jgi:hypothetical protein
MAAARAQRDEEREEAREARDDERQRQLIARRRAQAAEADRVRILLRGMGIRLPAKHVIGKPKQKSGKKVKFTATQSTARVLKRARRYIIDGRATLVGITKSDYQFEIPRKRQETKQDRRRFHLHRGGGNGLRLDLFEVESRHSVINSRSEYPDTDDEWESDDESGID